MSVSVRLSEEETALFKDYAAIKGMSVSEMIRISVLERIEDEFDIAIAEEAYRNYRKNPKTYSHDEAWKEILG